MEDQYTYAVFRDPLGPWVGMCAELAEIRATAETPESALRGIMRLAARALDEMARRGDTLPAPAVDLQGLGL